MSQLAREVILGATSEVTGRHDGRKEFTALGASLGPRRSSRLSLGTGDESVRAQHAYSDAGDLEAPLLHQSSAEAAEAAEVAGALLQERTDAFSKRVRIGINASWAVNVLLLASKAAVFVLSGSYAVLASAVDSLVDLLSQAVLAVAEYQAARFDERFPIGRTRMAELSVMTCAAIMFVSTALVIRESVGGLWEGFHGNIPPLEVDATLFGVLGGATAGKLALYLYCVALRKNPIMVALSEDHLNDVQSNLAAIIGAAVAAYLPKYWYADPIVAIVFSVLIIKSWVAICWEQGQKMIGLGAPDEVIEEVNQVTSTHHPACQLDRVTAYHHGSHVVVEVEVIMPATMMVRESHDVALALQHKIEAIESVERAFVHVDYERRSLEEHKVERNLKLGEKDVMKPLSEYLERTGSAGAGGSQGGAPTSPSLMSPSLGVGLGVGMSVGSGSGTVGWGPGGPGRSASSGSSFSAITVTTPANGMLDGGSDVEVSGSENGVVGGAGGGSGGGSGGGGGGGRKSGGGGTGDGTKQQR